MFVRTKMTQADCRRAIRFVCRECQRPSVKAVLPMELQADYKASALPSWRAARWVIALLTMSVVLVQRWCLFAVSQHPFLRCGCCAYWTSYSDPSDWQPLQTLEVSSAASVWCGHKLKVMSFFRVVKKLDNDQNNRGIQRATALDSWRDTEYLMWIDTSLSAAWPLPRLSSVSRSDS